MDLRTTVVHFLDLFPDKNKLETVAPLQAFPLLYGLTFQKNMFVQMGMSWSQLVEHFSPKEICLELDKVRSRVRSVAVPKGCPPSDIRFVQHVPSQNLAKTLSVPVEVDPSTVAMSFRAFNAETIPPPLKRQCLFFDEQRYCPMHLESGHALELHDTGRVRSSCGSAETEQPMSFREWTRCFPQYDMTKVEFLRLHTAFLRFLLVTHRDGHVVSDSLMEPEVYPSHFALRYKLIQEDESDLEGMRKAREWQPPYLRNL